MTNSSGDLTIRPQNPGAVSLRQLADQFGLALPDTGADASVTGVTINSRDVRPGDLYVGMPGARHHGAQFAKYAVEHGAVALLTDAAGRDLAIASGVTALPIAVTDVHPRTILGAVSAYVYGTDHLAAKVFGITGTNGKTSVVYLIAQLLQAAGVEPGLSSTAERRIGDEVIVSDLTSPESSELHGLLARMAERGVEGIALEVSAQAVDRHRIDGVHFDVVAFNNLSQDHLEEYGDMDNYFEAKAALFTSAHAERGVVVVDGVYGQRLAKQAQIPVTTLATEYGQSADWHLAVTAETLDGVSFVLQGPAGEHFRGRVPVFGAFMAENAALALIMLHEAGISVDRVAAGLTNGLIPVHIPGRLEEMTEGGDGPRFYVDYGHTPGSFAAMLDALGDVVEGKIIFMFGADGDRDTTKREDMGRIAAQGSDILIVCDYHPRSEPPEQIRAQLIKGAEAANHATIYEEADPKTAIRLALKLAGAGDVIVYAGPGHEDYQEVAGEFLPYSARDEVRGALREAGLLA